MRLVPPAGDGVGWTGGGPGAGIGKTGPGVLVPDVGAGCVVPGVGGPLLAGIEAAAAWVGGLDLVDAVSVLGGATAETFGGGRRWKLFTSVMVPWRRMRAGSVIRFILLARIKVSLSANRQR